MEPILLRTSDGTLDREDEPAFAALAARLRDGDAPLLLHLHGGLVDEESGSDTARRLGGAGAGAYNAPAEWEQVYFIWRTGVLETLRANWRDLHDNDRLYRALIEKLIGFIGGKIRSGLAGRSAAGEAGLSPAEIRQRLASDADAPFADLDAAADEAGATGRAAAVQEMDEFSFDMELRAVLQLDPQFTAAAEDIAAAAGHRAGRTAAHGDAGKGEAMLARLDGAVEEELRGAAHGEDAGRGLISLGVLKALIKHSVKVGWRVYKRIKAGRGHGVHATIVEEILRELYGNIVGGAIWGMMRKDAGDHFGPGKAGTRLIEAIEAGTQRRIVLVGHSAGAIWLSRMLLELARRGSRVKADVVLLAPAVRARLFHQAVTDAGDRIGRFRMFAMCDDWERSDPVLGKGTGALYPASLLYLVSGLFEEDAGADHVDAPLLGLERFRRWEGGTLGAEEDAAAEGITAFLASKCDSDNDAEVYAPSPDGSPPGHRSQGRSHGGMDEDPDTLQSVRTFLE